MHTGAIVAANAVVLDGTEVPPGALAYGVPAKIREGAARPELIADGVRNYVARTQRYRTRAAPDRLSGATRAAAGARRTRGAAPRTPRRRG